MGVRILIGLLADFGSAFGEVIENVLGLVLGLVLSLALLQQTQVVYNSSDRFQNKFCIVFSSIVMFQCLNFVSRNRIAVRVSCSKKTVEDSNVREATPLFDE
jgi:hypothetical protein